MSAAVNLDAALSAELTGLRALALRLTRNTSDADDLVQDTLVRACRFQDKFDSSKGGMGGWLRTIMRNIHVNAVHASTRRGCHTSAFGIEWAILGTMPSDPESEISRKEQVSKIRASVDALPEQYRIAVTMCDFNGMAYAEISKETGWPMGTVMSRIHRGRRMVECSLR